ncbi:MAG TPA: 6-bladed beta-propeller [Candidatus Saccharimonadales bacterium]|nr:6-bladed beta-propeller [Candidatus Saccharimonadales bacterium]
MSIRLYLLLLCLPSLPLVAQNSASPTQEAAAQAATRLRTLIEAAPKLPFSATEFVIQPPNADWATGMISWIARDGKGTLYLLQRGEKADPVLAVDRQGHVLRSWGKGLYKIPHSIRIDPQGNIWTVDASSSVVLKYSAQGEKLMEIDVGGQPENSSSAFKGTTDIAFGPNGQLFIADGYGNPRILEYTAEGKRVREWGSAGSGPGQFHLPHSIVVDEAGTIYVADRENGRIQRFDLNGKYLGEFANLGRTYSLKLSGGALWAGMQPLNEPTGSPGWLVKLDRRSGKILGYVAVPDKGGLHSVEIGADGGPITGVANHVEWFKAR